MSGPNVVTDALEDVGTENAPIPVTNDGPNFSPGNTQPSFDTPISADSENVVDDNYDEEPVAKLEPTPELSAQEVIEKIVPNPEPVDVTLSWEGHDEVFSQRPLTYFRKIEFFGLLGRTIEEIVNGPDGVNIDALFGDLAPSSIDDFRGNDLGELSTFIAAIAKLASYAPEFTKEAYLIILNVPHNKKAFAREALDYISDDLGEQILVRFIDQNYKELESFFTERSRKVLDHIQALRDQS